MKRKYELQWYEYNLTQKKCRKFFTEIGAMLYKQHIEKTQHTYVKIIEP